MNKRKRKLKGGVYNFLFAVGGAVIGETVALLSKNVKALSWLSHSVPLGITKPLEIDIIIAKFQLGFYLTISPSLVIFMALALAIGNLFLHQSQSSALPRVSIGADRMIKNDIENSEDE